VYTPPTFILWENAADAFEIAVANCDAVVETSKIKIHYFAVVNHMQHKVKSIVLVLKLV
jgi:hypothetical protein